MVDGFWNEINKERPEGCDFGSTAAAGSPNLVGSSDDAPVKVKQRWSTPELKELIPGTFAHARARAAFSKGA